MPQLSCLSKYESKLSERWIVECRICVSRNQNAKGVHLAVFLSRLMLAGRRIAMIPIEHFTENEQTYEKGVSRQIRIRIIQCAPLTATQSNPKLDGWWWCASINPNLGAPVLAWFTPNNLMRFANKVLACPNFR